MFKRVMLTFLICLYAASAGAEYRSNPYNSGKLDYYEGVTTLSASFLKLDQSTPQTVSASPIWNFGTATRIPFYSGTKTLTDDADLYFTSGTNTLYAGVLSSTALTLSGWTTASVPFMSATGYLTEDTDFNFVTGTNTLNSPNVTASGTVQAEQLTSTDDASVADLLSYDEADWTGGNVIYVPLTGSIEAYHDAATAGDTLVLASGTYTITDDIDVTKGIAIIGQGIGKTTVTCATASKNVFDISVSNVRIANMTITSSGGNISYGVNVQNNLTGVILENISVSATAASGKAYGINIIGSNATINNCTITSVVDAEASKGLWVNNNSSTTQDAVVNVYNSTISADATGSSSFGVDVYNNNDANIITANLYNCSLIGLAGAALDSGVYVNSTTTNNAKANLYNCICNGQDFDVAQNGTNVLTLYSTTLVNNTTSGTITYGGTVRTNNLVAGDLTTTSTSFVQAANLIQNAKLSMIEDINSLVGTSNIKGFWVFDQTGATTSITGRDPDATAVTLGGNASTLSPAVSGLCPNLTMNGSAATSFSIADNDKFSFTDGAGNDTAATVLILANPVALDAGYTQLAKYTSTSNMREWIISTDNAGKMQVSLYKNDDTAKIRQTTNAGLSTASWQVFGFTYSASETDAGIITYVNGSAVAQTAGGVGAGYAGMTNGTAAVRNFINDSSGISKTKYGVVLIINKELTAAECKRVSQRLQSYAGVFL